MSAKQQIPLHSVRQPPAPGARAGPARQQEWGNGDKPLPHSYRGRHSIQKEKRLPKPHHFVIPDKKSASGKELSTALRQETNFFQQRRKFLAAKGPSRIPAKPFLFDTKIQNTRHIMTSLPQAFTLPTPNHPLPFRHGPFGGTEMPPERE